MSELGSRFDFGFFAPVWLAIGIFAVAAVILLEIGTERRRRQAVTLFAASHLVQALTGSISLTKRRLKQFFIAAAVGLLFVAMARPHLLFRWSEETRSGLDVFLAIDCSKSMLTQDVQPNRLERAKLVVEDFADRLPDDRLGLIAFAGDAFLECPLTLDHDAFQTSVRELDTDTIPRPGTDIAAAIEEALTAVKSQPANLKFMILVTDGEDLEGRVPDIVKSAASSGLKIYTIGVGTPQGGQIPLLDETGQTSFLTDGNGQTVQSHLDEKTLRQIAETTGGAYEPLGQRGEGLEKIYNRYIAPLPKQMLKERREKIRFERFEWPLGAAIIFLIGEFLIRDRRRALAPAPLKDSRPRPKRRATRNVSAAAPVAGLILLLMTSNERTQASTADTAEREYKSGQYQESAQKYGEATETHPDRHDLQFNRGDAAYKAGEYNEAEDAYRKALDTPNLGLQENTYYNLGNAQFKDGEGVEKADSKKARNLWEQALHSYESALKLKAAADTKYNYDVVKKKLEQLEQQQHQQEQNKNNPQPSDNSKNQSGQGQNQSPQNQKDKSNPGNSGQNQPQKSDGNQPGDAGKDKGAMPHLDKNIPAQDQAQSGSRDQDQVDPGTKSRQEAEALLDSLKDDEHRVTARSLNANNDIPPPPSGKDW